MSIISCTIRLSVRVSTDGDAKNTNQKADTFIIAQIGNLRSFKKKFVTSDVNNKSKYGSGVTSL